MRLVTYDAGRGPRSGVVAGRWIHDLSVLHRAFLRARRERPASALPPEVLAVIERGAVGLGRSLVAFGESERPRGWRTRLDDAHLLPPIPHPPAHVVCVGRNYPEHAREGGNPVPEHPVFFTKPATALVGPTDDVRLPPQTQALDYETDLVVVIGARARKLDRGSALGRVFGYTLMNDVTARDLHRRHPRWFRGKGLDTFAPLGPWITAADEIPDPQSLRVRSWVNEEPRQDASTAGMISSVATPLEVLSAGMTLQPGALLATGTPDGVGMGFDPPRWLHDGDVVECEVDRIGRLRNHVVAVT